MDKKRKKFLTVYTVSSCEYYNDSMFHDVSGSYLHRGDAIRECADRVLVALENSQRYRELFTCGEFGEMLKKASIDVCDACRALENRNSLKKDDKVLQKALRMATDYISDLIGSDGCIFLDYLRFDVDENDVECGDGLQMWTCITSGRDDEDHDTEFEQAFPEVFLSEDAAVECAIDDLKSCLEGYSKEEVRAIVNEARERIAENGHFEFDLNDSKQRIWDIWSTPIDIGQGSGKIQRN